MARDTVIGVLPSRYMRLEWMFMLVFYLNAERFGNEALGMNQEHVSLYISNIQQGTFPLVVPQ